MSDSLVAKIQWVLDVVAPIFAENRSSEYAPAGVKRDGLYRLSQAAEDVQYLAIRAGIDQYLPARDPDDLHVSCKSRCTYKTCLNIAGYWDGPFFVLYPVESWEKSMLLVRRLAAAVDTRPAKADNELWFTQNEVRMLFRLDYSEQVSRLCNGNELVTNGEKSKGKRIAGTSVLRYALRQGIAIDPDGIERIAGEIVGSASLSKHLRHS